jgi:BirA family biotin operon repressor/biotin-[acetyl-CoA-carboxylase] ligase
MSSGGFRIERFTSIESTNSYLLKRAREGEPAGLVAVADHQTAGRGRLDRSWEAPAGSALLASVLLREALGPDEVHLLTAAVALAAAAGVERLANLRPQLKWPNDLIVEGAKLAGILAEADAGAPGGAPGTTAVVVGLGLNLSWPGPEGAGGTSLAEAAGAAVDRDALLDALLAELEERIALLRTPRGRSALRAELEVSLATLGQQVVVSTPAGTVEGLATGLSAEGHLLVETAAGPVEVITGDVLRLRPSPGEPSKGE